MHKQLNHRQYNHHDPAVGTYCILHIFSVWAVTPWSTFTIRLTTDNTTTTYLDHIVCLYSILHIFSVWAVTHLSTFTIRLTTDSTTTILNILYDTTHILSVGVYMHIILCVIRMTVEQHTQSPLLLKNSYIAYKVKCNEKYTHKNADLHPASHQINTVNIVTLY